MARTPLDLRQYRSAQGAAGALLAWIRKQEQESGGVPEFATCKPHMRDGQLVRNAWAVSWEPGPYQWTMAMTGGESIYFEEYGAEMEALGMTPSREPEVLVAGAQGWIAEPENGFTLVFRQ